eukprot:Gregarina_sp_Poly_1__2082@NODE_154_length_12409_cov_137_944904_g136_i0_p5_GENE_NODE_154_length_12409_cov_137_944904_g136_i0NODE_154_length_12409_cov_137_944904_g136_i0_p5_ORF_typecomplete_len371_score43_14Lipase_3/PF01764_25/2_4e22DUF2974/PF11187_8/8_9e07DUF676/PF05057_14/4_5e05PGAP1/PF07819_13/0_011Abhydrolase_3/PF07859_13/0_018DUF818/PF05677_12/0_07Abhydrolase_6/PF12697_7/0_061Hydrolase_4/PF12146_8/0_24Chlorophyllase2/PF12740_7/0_2_NODE_154_length_12409_cov_137_944904_g136_i021103222
MCEVDRVDPLEILLDPYHPGEEISQKEGKVTYHLFKALWEFQQYANRGGLCGVSFPPENVVHGWRTVLELGVSEPAVRALKETNNTHIRTGLVMQKSDNEFLVLIRGTSNDYEWNKNFRTQLTPLDKGFGHVHAGVYELAQSLFPSIVALLSRRARQTSSVLRITFAGHSLGGGIANVLGLLALQASHSAKLTQQLEVQVITLASPRCLDPVASQALSSQARGVRNWLSELDAVPQLPCAAVRGFPRCDSRTAFGAHGSGSDFYADHVNPILISVEELKKLNPKFGIGSWGTVRLDLSSGILKLDASDIRIPAPLQLTAYHICAYACYLSTHYCLSDAERQNRVGWMCHDCPWTLDPLEQPHAATPTKSV